MKLKLFIFSLFFIPITIFFSYIPTSLASVSLYISADQLNVGVTCTSAGDNIATLDALYLMASTSDINTPATGFSSPNPMDTECPGNIPIYGPAGVQDPRSGLNTNGYLDDALRLKVDPNPGTPNYYEYFYLNDCSGTLKWTLDNLSCAGGGGGSSELEGFLDPLVGTSTDNEYLGGINFGLGIIIVILTIYLVAYMYNTFNKKKKTMAVVLIYYFVYTLSAIGIALMVFSFFYRFLCSIFDI